MNIIYLALLQVWVTFHTVLKTTKFKMHKSPNTSPSNNSTYTIVIKTLAVKNFDELKSIFGMFLTLSIDSPTHGTAIAC